MEGAGDGYDAGDEGAGRPPGSAGVAPGPTRGGRETGEPPAPATGGCAGPTLNGRCAGPGARPRRSAEEGDTRRSRPSQSLPADCRRGGPWRHPAANQTASAAPPHGSDRRSTQEACPVPRHDVNSSVRQSEGASVSPAASSLPSGDLYTDNCSAIHRTASADHLQSLNPSISKHCTREVDGAPSTAGSSFCKSDSGNDTNGGAKNCNRNYTEGSTKMDTSCRTRDDTRCGRKDRTSNDRMVRKIIIHVSVSRDNISASERLRCTNASLICPERALEWHDDGPQDVARDASVGTGVFRHQGAAGSRDQGEEGRPSVRRPRRRGDGRRGGPWRSSGRPPRGQRRRRASFTSSSDTDTDTDTDTGADTDTDRGAVARCRRACPGAPPLPSPDEGAASVRQGLGLSQAPPLVPASQASPTRWSGSPISSGCSWWSRSESNPCSSTSESSSNEWEQDPDSLGLLSLGGHPPEADRPAGRQPEVRCFDSPPGLTSTTEPQRDPPASWEKRANKLRMLLPGTVEYLVLTLHSDHHPVEDHGGSGGVGYCGDDRHQGHHTDEESDTSRGGDSETADVAAGSDTEELSDDACRNVRAGDAGEDDQSVGENEGGNDGGSATPSGETSGAEEEAVPGEREPPRAPAEEGAGALGAVREVVKFDRTPGAPLWRRLTPHQSHSFERAPGAGARGLQQVGVRWMLPRAPALGRLEEYGGATPCATQRASPRAGCARSSPETSHVKLGSSVASQLPRVPSDINVTRPATYPPQPQVSDAQTGAYASPPNAYISQPGGYATQIRGPATVPATFSRQYQRSDGGFGVNRAPPPLEGIRCHRADQTAHQGLDRGGAPLEALSASSGHIAGVVGDGALASSDPRSNRSAPDSLDGSREQHLHFPGGRQGHPTRTRPETAVPVPPVSSASPAVSAAPVAVRKQTGRYPEQSYSAAPPQMRDFFEQLSLDSDEESGNQPQAEAAAAVSTGSVAEMRPLEVRVSVQEGLLRSVQSQLSPWSRLGQANSTTSFRGYEQQRVTISVSTGALRHPVSRQQLACHQPSIPAAQLYPALSVTSPYLQPAPSALQRQQLPLPPAQTIPQMPLPPTQTVQQLPLLPAQTIQQMSLPPTQTVQQLPLLSAQTIQQMSLPPTQARQQLSRPPTHTTPPKWHEAKEFVPRAARHATATSSANQKQSKGGDDTAQSGSCQRPPPDVAVDVWPNAADAVGRQVLGTTQTTQYGLRHNSTMAHPPSAQQCATHPGGANGSLPQQPGSSLSNQPRRQPESLLEAATSINSYVQTPVDRDDQTLLEPVQPAQPAHFGLREEQTISQQSHIVRHYQTFPPPHLPLPTGGQDHGMAATQVQSIPLQAQIIPQHAQVMSQKSEGAAGRAQNASLHGYTPPPARTVVQHSQATCMATRQPLEMSRHNQATFQPTQFYLAPPPTMLPFAPAAPQQAVNMQIPVVGLLPAGQIPHPGGNNMLLDQHSLGAYRVDNCQSTDAQRGTKEAFPTSARPPPDAGAYLQMAQNTPGATGDQESNR